MTYPDLKIIIGGKEIQALARDGEDVYDPATGEAFAKLPHATADDMEAVISSAEAAFPGWRDKAPLDRSAILRKAATLIRERIDDIATAMTKEQGKPLAESKGEIAYSANVIDWYAEEGRRAYGRIIPASLPGLSQIVTKEPVGLAAAFTPWNFPALTPCRKIGGALAAGCCLVLKAAEETPGTAVMLVQAFHDAGLPPGVLNLVFGNPADISSQLIDDRRIRKISFTGSIGVGKLLVRQAADTLKRTTMELGGHGPVLVFDDADVNAAADMLAAGKFRNAGQVCISPTRFYVHDRVIDQFTERFVSNVKRLKVGNGFEEGTTMGPLANQRRLEAIEELVGDAVERGGDILTGGKRIGNAGFFFEPTVIRGLPDDCRVMTEEPFGPVAPIVGFRELDEVLNRANSLPFGLASYAFTSSLSTSAAVERGLQSGMVGINTLGVSNPEGPFGGMKESGYGQEGGSEGLEAYLETKYVARAS
ncbi:NAD-dependent succinate-semialdehyde dehydrogenase [Parvularcula marina]|uniref:NAD-dependent succinate-semialdehyde dehydrogenase n=1 Tax=Parvularcula marina TaxID=2292771 RepID=A0A371RLD4_9PROT|nr:NAD-dependent succinate-semialdehyde dehydrogenase [Parvularcula marina]RFB06280.1 NAD-dependent succinate-semialdehyde dehydrogenase [Parvularcula marina]